MFFKFSQLIELGQVFPMNRAKFPPPPRYTGRFLRDYAGLSYASLIQLCIIWTSTWLCGIWLCLVVVSVMYPLNLREIMRDLVMPRWIRLCILWTYARLCGIRLCLVGFGYVFVCLCCFSYVIIYGYVLCIISMILYYIKDITYELI